MRTVNSVDVRADLDSVFKLAEEIELWPMLLPHYRWVTSKYNEDRERVVEMAAKRSWIPVKWTSVQEVFRQDAKIFYKHIGGLTCGMCVEWSFEQLNGSVRVTIIHDLHLTVPIVSTQLGKFVVSEFFVKNIADKTLQCIKVLAEEKQYVT